MLISMLQNGDKEAEEKLVAKNAGLVHSIAVRFLQSGKEYEDLYQIGCIGLLKAARRFDLSLDIMFSTYAVHIITGEIKRYIRDDGPIKVSRSLKSLYAEIKRFSEKKCCENGRYPTVNEIAAGLNISLEDVVMAMEAGLPIQYLEQTIGDDDSLQLLDVLEDEKESFDEKIISSVSLREAAKTLEQREKSIINLRYFKGKTQMEVAQMIGISQVQVSRLEKKILKYLREKIG